MTSSFSLLSRRARLLAAAMAVLLLITGAAIGVLVPMLRAPGDDSVDAGFARDMSTHHAQAVEMAMFAFRQGDAGAIRTLGYDMAATQQWQVGAMQTLLTQWHLSPTSDRPAMAWMTDAPSLQADGRMPGMASNAELDTLKRATGKPFDVLWCQLMLRHHLGGIHMAEVAATQATQAQVGDLAEKIKNSQTYDITLLEKLLKDLDAQPLPS